MDTRNAVKALLAKPSIEGLIYALRHKETWPDGFEWDYRGCSTCAMGLAARLWEEIEFPSWYEVGDALKMNRVAAIWIFNDLPTRTEKASSAITPEHVAAALEAYLETLRRLVADGKLKEVPAEYPWYVFKSVSVEVVP